METATIEISKEEKEKILSDKIESMRKKNEELRKRHEEIEADKRLADEHSAGVQMEEVKIYIMKPTRPKPEKILNVAVEEGDTNSTAQDSTSPRQRLNQEDGPPPDPSYRFLADPDRDGTEVKEKKNNLEDNNESEIFNKRGRGRGRGASDRGRGRGGRGRGRYSEEGTERGGRSFPRRGRGGERAYDQWKAERNAIDEARISRARSGDGEWKREWDMAKIDQENEVAPEPEFEYSFNQRKRGDSFKLKDLLTDEVKTKLEADDKPETRRGDRPNRRARQMRRGTFGDRTNDEQRQQTNWREKNANNPTESSYFQTRQEKHHKFKQNVTDKKPTVESNNSESIDD